MQNGEKGKNTGRSSAKKYNRFSRQDQEYGLHYNSGHARYGVKNKTGFAEKSRSRDLDWADGRNTYWTEKYHSQGHESGGIGGKLKQLLLTIKWWLSGKKDKPQTGSGFDDFKY